MKDHLAYSRIRGAGTELPTAYQVDIRPVDADTAGGLNRASAHQRSCMSSATQAGSATHRVASADPSRSAAVVGSHPDAQALLFRPGRRISAAVLDRRCRRADAGDAPSVCRPGRVARAVDRSPAPKRALGPRSRAAPSPATRAYAKAGPTRSPISWRAGRSATWTSCWRRPTSGCRSCSACGQRHRGTRSSPN